MKKIILASCLLLCCSFALFAANWQTFDSTNAPFNNNQVVFTTFHNDTAWVATLGSGLAKRYGSIWQMYRTTNSSIGSNLISAVAIDNSGNKWIGTRTNGLVRLQGSNTFQAFNTGNSGISSNNLNHVFHHAGSIYAATQGGGLSVWNGSVWTIFNRFNSAILSDTVYHVSRKSDGTFWIATPRGLSVYNGTTFTNYTPQNSGLPVADIRFTAHDASGNTWIATNGGGLVRLTGGTVWNVFNQTTSNFPTSNSVSSIDFDSQNNVWFTTNGGGIGVYDGINFFRFTTTNTAGNLRSNLVYHLHIRNNVKYISSNKGWTVTNQAILSIKPNGATTFCQGLSVTLQAQTTATIIPLSYRWYRDGNLISGALNSTLTVTTSGNYTVEATEADNSVLASRPIVVTVNVKPIVSITSNPGLVLCGSSGTTVLSATAGFTYSWQRNGVTLPQTTQSIPVSDTGIYKVR
jgi:ligand-binding sensor domain-containing protein